jgi:hypothetical protein
MKQIKIKGYQTYLDGTQSKFESNLNDFQISVGLPITISDLNELPLNLESLSRNSFFTITKINL